jgi:hypothetical protein
MKTPIDTTSKSGSPLYLVASNGEQMKTQLITDQELYSAAYHLNHTQRWPFLRRIVSDRWRYLAACSLGSLPNAQLWALVSPIHSDEIRRWASEDVKGLTSAQRSKLRGTPTKNIFSNEGPKLG